MRFLLDDLILHPAGVWKPLQLFLISSGQASRCGERNGGSSAARHHCGWHTEQLRKPRAYLPLKLDEIDEVVRRFLHGLQHFGVHDGSSEMSHYSDTIDHRPQPEA